MAVHKCSTLISYLLSTIGLLVSFGKANTGQGKETQNTWHSQLLNLIVSKKKILCDVVTLQPLTSFMNSIVVNFR